MCNVTLTDSHYESTNVNSFINSSRTSTRAVWRKSAQIALEAPKSTSRSEQPDMKESANPSEFSFGSLRPNRTKVLSHYHFQTVCWGRTSESLPSERHFTHPAEGTACFRWNSLNVTHSLAGERVRRRGDFWMLSPVQRLQIFTPISSEHFTAIKMLGVPGGTGIEDEEENFFRRKCRRKPSCAYALQSPGGEAWRNEETFSKWEVVKSKTEAFPHERQDNEVIMRKIRTIPMLSSKPGESSEATSDGNSLGINDHYKKPGGRAPCRTNARMGFRSM